MKVRLGFVSNSSSASFIVIWKSNIVDLEKPSKFPSHVHEAVAYLLEEDCFKIDDDGDACGFSEYTEKKLGKIYEEIVSKTKITQEGNFQTTFFEVMFNDLTSFSDDLRYFLQAIEFDRLMNGKVRSEVLHKELDCD